MKETNPSERSGHGGRQAAGPVRPGPEIWVDVFTGLELKACLCRTSSGGDADGRLRLHRVLHVGLVAVARPVASCARLSAVGGGWQIPRNLLGTIVFIFIAARRPSQELALVQWESTVRSLGTFVFIFIAAVVAVAVVFIFIAA